MYELQGNHYLFQSKPQLSAPLVNVICQLCGDQDTLHCAAGLSTSQMIGDNALSPKTNQLSHNNSHRRGERTREEVFEMNIDVFQTIYI